MPQQCLAIYDTVTRLWLISWDPVNQTGQFGSNPKAAICFTSEEQRQVVLDILNQSNPGRFIGQNPPPR